MSPAWTLVLAVLGIVVAGLLAAIGTWARRHKARTVRQHNLWQ